MDLRFSVVGGTVVPSPATPFIAERFEADLAALRSFVFLIYKTGMRVTLTSEGLGRIKQNNAHRIPGLHHTLNEQ